MSDMPSDILYDALLRPYSQLMIIAIIIELVLLYLVIKKCQRVDLKLAFILFMIGSLLAQILAVASDSSSGLESFAYSVGSTVMVFLIPALTLLLVFTYMHSRLGMTVKIGILLVFIMALVVILSFSLPEPSFIDSAAWNLGRTLLLFVYICVALGGAASEILLEKPPESLLLLMYVLPLIAVWPIYIFGFSSQGVHVFSQRTNDPSATASVMAPLFLTSFLNIPFAAAIFTTNPIQFKTKICAGSVTKPDCKPILKQSTKSPVVWVQEIQPKYSYLLFRNLSGSRTDALLLTKNKPNEMTAQYKLDISGIVHLSALDEKKNVIHPRELNRINATISMFVESRPGCVILLDGIDYLFANNALFDVITLLSAISRKAGEHGCILIIPLSLLTFEERNWVRSIRGRFIEAPELSDELPDLVNSVLGPAGNVILDKVLGKIGVNLKDAEFSHLPDIARILKETVMNIGEAESPARKKDWESSAERLYKSVLALSEIQQGCVE